MTGSTAVIGETNSGTEAIAPENPSAISLIMPPKTSSIDGKAHIGTAYKSSNKVGEKVDTSIFTTSSILDATYKPVKATPNGSIAKPPLFISGDKVVSSREFTAPSAPPKEITRSGPTFGLENVVSSNNHVADAPLVEFGSNKNVHKVPPMPFTASQSVGAEPSFLKFVSSDSNLGSSIRLVYIIYCGFEQTSTQFFKHLGCFVGFVCSSFTFLSLFFTNCINNSYRYCCLLSYRYYLYGFLPQLVFCF